MRMWPYICSRHRKEAIRTNPSVSNEAIRRSAGRGRSSVLIAQLFVPSNAGAQDARA
jgi:hypothetical protein